MPEAGGDGDDGPDDRSMAAVESRLALVLSRLSDLATGLDETRSELRVVAEATKGLAAAQADLDRRVAEIGSALAAQPTSTQLAEAFRGEIAHAESRLARTLYTQRAELYDALTEGLNQARTELASLGQQFHDGEVTLTQLVDTHRNELRTALSDRVREEVATLVRAAEELTHTRDQLHSRLDTVLASAVDTEVRLNELASSVEAGAARVHVLEQQMQEPVKLTVGDAPAPAPPPAPVPNLVEALDRQIEEAEMRLARRGSARDR
ncbi:MAG: hypothetical protein ACR2KK_23595 [Acidimicrobiales bacterium]